MIASYFLIFTFLWFLEMAEFQTVAKQPLKTDPLSSALWQQFDKMYFPQISPEKCRARGKGLEGATLGERATALLYVVDTHGKAYASRTDPVESLICELVSESTREKVDCSVKKSGANGFYEISYQATSRGRHQLHIKVEEEHIIGSPFVVLVKQPLEKVGTPSKTITEINQPCGVAINSKGNIIVVETGGCCISIYSPRVKIKSFGSGGSGPGQFNEPAGVTVDDEDNILVADSGNNRIQKFTSDGKFLAAADNLGLNNPTGVAIHPRSKKLFVSDTGNNCIKILNPDLTFSSSFGSPGYGDGELNSPYDVAFDSTGKVYVADFWNNRIQVFTAEGRYLTQFKSKGSGKGELFGPISINIDSEDVLYVTEYGYDRISVFKCDGQFLRQFGSSGSALGQFDGPFGVVLDKDGNIYVSDSCNNRVQSF